MATSSKRGKRSQVSDIQKCSSEVLFNPDQNFPLSWSFPDQCKTLNWAQRGNSQFFPLLLNFIAGNIKCSAALCSYFGGKSMQLSCMAINYIIKNNLTVNFWIYLWQTVMGCVGRMGSDTVTEVWRRVNTWHTKLERHRLSSYYHSLSLQWAWLCPQWCSGWFAGFLICSVVPSMMTLFCFSFYLFFSAGRICWVFFFQTWPVCWAASQCGQHTGRRQKMVAWDKNGQEPCEEKVVTKGVWGIAIHSAAHAAKRAPKTILPS